MTSSDIGLNQLDMLELITDSKEEEEEEADLIVQVDSSLLL